MRQVNYNSTIKSSIIENVNKTIIFIIWFVKKET